MTAPPRSSGRPVTLAGLRVIVFTMAGFQLAWTLAAFFAKGTALELDPELATMLLPAGGLLAVSELAAFFFLRLRFKKLWQRELAERPYKTGGPLPTNFAQSALIGAALAEGVGLFGAVIHFLSGDPYGLLLAGLAFFSILALLPREETLLNTRGNL